MSKLLARLDELEKAAQSAPEDYDDERRDTAENFKFVYAVAAAYPKLRGRIKDLEDLVTLAADYLDSVDADRYADQIREALAALGGEDE